MSHHPAVAQARRAVSDPDTFHWPPGLRQLAWAILHSARGNTAAPLQRAGTFRPVGAVAREIIAGREGRG
jgi:hypothetical protein